jgi:hypothetical protein
MDDWSWEHPRPWIALIRRCRSVRRSAPTTDRRADSRSRAPPHARSCAGSPPRPASEGLEDLNVAPAARWRRLESGSAQGRWPRSRRRAQPLLPWGGRGRRSRIRAASVAGRARSPRAGGRISARRACTGGSAAGSRPHAGRPPSFQSENAPNGARASGRAPVATSARRARRSPTPRCWAGRRGPGALPAPLEGAAEAALGTGDDCRPAVAAGAGAQVGAHGRRVHAQVVGDRHGGDEPLRGLHALWERQGPGGP